MELLLFLFVLLVAWPFVKGVCLFFADRDEWKRVRERDHQKRMANRSLAGGVFGLVRRFFGG